MHKRPLFIYQEPLFSMGSDSMRVLPPSQTDRHKLGPIQVKCNGQHQKWEELKIHGERECEN